MSITMDDAGTTSSRASAAPADLYSVLFDRNDASLEVVSSSRLTRVGARPPLGTYAKQVWQRRHFLIAEARAKVGSGTQENLLGKAWLVLSPILDGLMYFLIFGLLLRTNGKVENFVGFLVIGVFLFSFTARCVTSGARSVTAGRNLIRAFTFPRVSLPIAVVLRETLNMLPVLGAMLVLLLAMPPVERWSWRLALVPLVFLLQAVFATGLSMLFARICATLPDLTQIIGFGTRLWMYGSGVMLPVERFVDHPAVLAMVRANPMFIVLDMVRNSVLYAQTPPMSQWLALAAWSLGLFILGFLVFWKAEETYGRA